ncbi:MAG TPA: DUF2177 family protein [Vicinamibacterales bacterium]|nr:DUF2177 family protein [Vicinamibacterales bacterium]
MITGTVVRGFGIALAVLIVLDGLWLGVLMKDFYRRSLAPLARMADGGLAPIWPIAALVYPVLAAGLAVLVLSRNGTPLQAAALGTFFGCVTYAVYDLTNHATLREWPAMLTVVDIAWGSFSCATAAWLAATFIRPS